MFEIRKGRPVQVAELAAEELERLAALRGQHSAAESELEQYFADRMAECCGGEFEQYFADRAAECCGDDWADEEFTTLCTNWGERYEAQFTGLEWGNGNYWAIADIEEKGEE